MGGGLFLGLMSGTSMDTVDAVLTEISGARVEVRHHRSTPIPPALHRRLTLALDSSRLDALECWRLDAAVGELFAHSALQLLEAARVPPSEVAAIGSHGQTIYHAPDNDPALTIQIGDPNVIASRTGITTVADFRRMDVAAGGQGAPLAPLFHRVVFAGEQQRVLLNLGGIANVTVLPAGGSGRLTGFDTGPANTLMDAWCSEHRGEPFDRDGRWASSGTVQSHLLDRLRADPFFDRAPPKSTGRELFNRGWLDTSLSELPPLPAEDVQRSLVELTATTIADAIRRHAPDASELYACGGGALNSFLMQRLAALLADRALESTSVLGIPPMSVEGAAFAWLAHERLAQRAAGRPSVTGAKREASLGGVYRP